MLALPAHAPMALHLPVGGAGVGSPVGAGVGASVGRGGAGVGAGPPSLVIVISAQLTNVSCGPKPMPHLRWPLTISHPQLLPVFHHHCRTQWSQLSSFGS